MGKLHKEKFNQLPVRSRLIFLADHLANHHNEDTYNFLLMILKSLSLRISVLPQFWGVVMRGGNPSTHLRKDLLGPSVEMRWLEYVHKRYKSKRNRQLEWHKIHWEPVKEALSLDIPTRYCTINLIRLRNLLYSQRKNGIQGLQQR